MEAAEEKELSKKMEIELLGVYGVEHALYGMRNPFNSHDNYDTVENAIGEKDLKRAQALTKAGAEHRKYLRQIQVWINLTTTRYIWQELDTYKFGTKNSESTMHTLSKRPFELSDFYLGETPSDFLRNHFEVNVIPLLNGFRKEYLVSKDYEVVREMKRMLPESFLQMRTWNTNFEELFNIYRQRKGHRMKEEWQMIREFIEKIPAFKELVLDAF